MDDSGNGQVASATRGAEGRPVLHSAVGTKDRSIARRVQTEGGSDKCRFHGRSQGKSPVDTSCSPRILGQGNKRMVYRRDTPDRSLACQV